MNLGESNSINDNHNFTQIDKSELRASNKKTLVSIELQLQFQSLTFKSFCNAQTTEIQDIKRRPSGVYFDVNLRLTCGGDNNSGTIKNVFCTGQLPTRLFIWSYF